MKSLLLTLSLLLAFGLPFPVVAAQTGDAATPEQFDGITSIYDRTFLPEQQKSLASPAPVSQGSDDYGDIRMASIQAITFETDDNAEAYLDLMRDGANSGNPRDEELGAFVITELENPGIEGFKMTTDMGDFDFGATIVFFIDGNQAFQIMVMELDQPTSEALAEDLIEFILDTEAENDEINFNVDGTSTGGVFDRMPTAEDAVTGDLTDVTDTELFVSGT